MRVRLNLENETVHFEKRNFDLRFEKKTHEIKKTHADVNTCYTAEILRKTREFSIRMPMVFLFLEDFLE